MPGLSQHINGDDNQFSSSVVTTTSLSCSNGSVSVNGFWSKHSGGDVSYNQLQKFWSELSSQARQELLRIDKQYLFEQARKNMYCSRCNGLLLEGYLQIVMYGKSFQQDGAVGHVPCRRLGASENQNNGDLCVTTGCRDEVQDPSVHPWGGLTTTRDGMLTLLDCYLHSKSLKGLQNVFDSARARERERELLYPDACGGGGRGWISQGMANYGRGHGTRETCALHTARLSVDTLVDFWSALGEETRQSLLRIKEEDFIERLMYRFDSKRFCRDCRRNVIREFKDLKELKRMRREHHCTSWFCVADTNFQYEVTHDTVQADWHQTFMDTLGTYHHFEWAVGTAEGKSDILEFENVGLGVRVQMNGLDLSGLNACYITVRACKLNGRCTELSGKAHALKGQQCVHCRIVVGDGFVTITRGESMRSFFEHAEEAEEEEDDDPMDKDGNEADGECTRPQKHAKSPELAREFLLDAATVIFKEQVEKAFREGTARQNAHSIFVSLALKLLEDRVHVACKEIVTLEKQMKLLEEEEKEKREEEERKERRRMKEREKKLRRKERLREKEKDKEKKCSSPDDIIEESTPSVDGDTNVIDHEDLVIVSETGDIISSRPASPDFQDEISIGNMQNHFDDSPDEVFSAIKDENGSFRADHSVYSRRKLNFRKEFQQVPTSKWSDRRRFAPASENGGVVSKPEQRYYADPYETCSRTNNGVNKQSRGDNAAKSNPRINGPKFAERLHSSHRAGDRYDSHACSCYNQRNEYRAGTRLESQCSATRIGRDGKAVCKSESTSDMSVPYHRVKLKTKYVATSSSHIKQVWEPMESQTKYPRSNSDPDVTLRSTGIEKPIESLGPISHNEIGGDTAEMKQDNIDSTELNSLTGTTDASLSSTSNSDSCSSCLSEGDSNNGSSSSNPQNPESDSEDASQHSEERETSRHLPNGFHECQDVSLEHKKQILDGVDSVKSGGINDPLPTKIAQTGKPNVTDTGSQPQVILAQPLHSQSVPFQMFRPPSMGYYHQSALSWPAVPTNGLVPLPHPNHYLFASPFTYGMNRDSYFMQYGGGLRHLSSPLLNPAPLPVYQPVATQTNGIKEAHNVQRIIPTGHCPMEVQPNAEGEKKGDTGFSLFHFGDPVALANGYKSNPLPPKESVGDHIVGDITCNKKDGIGEYNLFAAGNGIKFSFF